MVVIEVACLMEGEWSLERWSVYWRRMVLLQRRIVYLSWKGHVREVASLMEGEWSCYGGGQFKGGRMVMLQRWSV